MLAGATRCSTAGKLTIYKCRRRARRAIMHAKLHNAGLCNDGHGNRNGTATMVNAVALPLPVGGNRIAMGWRWQRPGRFFNA